MSVLGDESIVNEESVNQLVGFEIGSALESALDSTLSKVFFNLLIIIFLISNMFTRSTAIIIKMP
jgi:hypothetical protein